MSTITSTIILRNKMTPVLQSVIRSLRSTVNAMSSLDSASDKAFDAAKRDIQAADDALKEFQDDLDKIPPAARRAAGGFSSIQATIVSINQGLQLGRSLMSGIYSLTKISDEMTQMAARVKLINDGHQTDLELQNKIYQAAQRSRGAYSDIADTVAKLNLLAGKAFTNNDESILFAETMQKAFAVSGATVSEQSAALHQMSQALASGVLRGDEFNSIMENAPLIAKAIEDYLGVTRAELRELSSDGAITADIIKNAVFEAAGDINEQFNDMPLTFSNAMQMIKNTAMIEFQEVNNTISKAFNNGAFQSGIKQISAAIARVAKFALWLTNLIVSNWTVISNVLLAAGIMIGTITALILLQKSIVIASNIAMAARIVLTALTTKATIAEAASMVAATGATVSATAAQWAFNASLLANPITWVVIAIIAIIAAIILWIRHIGGLKIAWLTVVNLVLTQMAKLKIGFFTGVYFILDMFGLLALGAKAGFVAVANFVGDLKVEVLTVLQNMINGAIGLINTFIGILNKIPGVSIDAISEVTFAATASAENEAAKAAREQDLDEAREALKEARAQREANLTEMERIAEIERRGREQTIAATKAQKAAENSTEDQNDLLESMLAESELTNDVLGGAGGGATVKGNLDLSDEDIKLLKDVAAVEWVNKFTTLRPEVSVTFGDVHETADANKLLTVIEDMVEEAYASALVEGAD